MPGYSGTPLPTKLGIKPGHTVLVDHAPEGFELDVPAGVRVVRRLPVAADVALDVALTFQTRRPVLERRLPQLLERTATAGMTWVCWPKRSAQRSARNPEGPVSDLDENVVRALGLAAGVVDVKVAAIDETWSGLKLVRRLADR